MHFNMRVVRVAAKRKAEMLRSMLLERLSSRAALVVLLVWVCAVGALAFGHVMWRDEVRALSIALSGQNAVEMLSNLRGEGHPAVWYLMLRSAYDVFGRVEVLPVLSLLVAAISVAILLFRSPFPPLVLIFLVFSGFYLSEFSVTARNYGISALILLVIAAVYARYRDKSIVIGVLLFVLANTNVIAAMLVGAFLVFWAADILQETGLRWSPALRNVLINAGIALAGIVLCGLTVWPTYNDAAAVDPASLDLPRAALLAVLNPGGTGFGALGLPPLLAEGLPGQSILVSVLLYGATLGLLPRRSAFLGALTGLIGLSVFFALGAGGSYRHAGVWFFFVVALYWIAWPDIRRALSDAARPAIARSLTIAALSGCLLLVGLQSFRGVARSVGDLAGILPVNSRSADVAQLIKSNVALGDAVILSDPDYLVEPLPYYIGNRTYLTRSDALGSVVKFSRAGILHRDLGDLLRQAQALKASLGVPVVILLSQRLDQIVPGRVYHEGYNWTFRGSAEDIRTFQESTETLARLGPARTGETYDVYVLK
ncbi:hypothetical protein [Blastochloris tepida]|nr:hypothetical protein [Blastochloris tepida]